MTPTITITTQRTHALPPSGTDDLSSLKFSIINLINYLSSYKSSGSSLVPPCTLGAGLKESQKSSSDTLLIFVASAFSALSSFRSLYREWLQIEIAPTKIISTTIKMFLIIKRRIIYFFSLWKSLKNLIQFLKNSFRKHSQIVDDDNYPDNNNPRQIFSHDSSIYPTHI